MPRNHWAVAVVILSVAGGCAAPGEDSNYKELERSPNTPQDEPGTRGTYGRDDAAATPVQLARLEDPVTENALDDTAEALEAEALTDTKIVGPSTDPDAVTPSMGAFNRANWPKVKFMPADGRTVHNPSYYGEVPLGDDAISVISPPDPVWRMQEALSGAKPGNWDAQNLGQFAWDLPIGFGLTTLSVPVQAVGEPPWKQVTTPTFTRPAAEQRGVWPEIPLVIETVRELPPPPATLTPEDAE